MRRIGALFLVVIVASGGSAGAQEVPTQPGIEAPKTAAPGGLRRALGGIRQQIAARLRAGTERLGTLRSLIPQQGAGVRGTLSSLFRRFTSRGASAGVCLAGTTFAGKPRAAATRFVSLLGARGGLAKREGTSLRELLRSHLTDAPAGDKEWTVFVYMNGDNNLHEPLLEEIKDLTQVGSTERVNVVALWDGNKEYSRGDGNEGSKLLLIEKGGTKVLKDFGEVDMGSSETLEESLSFVMKEFPAARTALIVGNHGMGWQGVSADATSQSDIPVDQVGAALDSFAKKTGRKLDLLGYDACLMNSAEATFPVRNAAKYLVASQELEYRYGWDFAGMLGALAKTPTMDGKQLAKTIVQTYGDAYREGGCYSKEKLNVVLSAIDLEKFCGAMKHIDSFAEALKGGSKGMNKEAITAALDGVQRFGEARRTSLDLVDFTRKVAATTQDPEIKQCATRLDDYLTNEVIICNTVVGKYHDNAHGMSIYLPGDSYQDGYSTYKAYQRPDYIQISMSKESKWREMLDTYYPPKGSVFPKN